MSFLLDTHAFLWWTTDADSNGRPAKKAKLLNSIRSCLPKKGDKIIKDKIIGMDGESKADLEVRVT